VALHCGHIGINFEGTSNALRGCINDAKDFFKVFRPLCQSGDILTERSATIGEVRQFLAERLGVLKAGDLLFLSRSSHGTQIPDRDGDEQDGKDEAFVCYGLDLLADDEFATILAKREAGSFVVVFDDCCHSGTGLRFVGDPDRPADALPRNLPWQAIPQPTRDNFQRGAPPPPSAARGVLHIAACQAHEVAWDGSRNGRANGAGTLAFLDSLAALTPGGTWGDLFSGICSRLPSKQYKQTPYGSGDTSLLAMPVKRAQVAVVQPPPVTGGDGLPDVLTVNGRRYRAEAS
jgi:hypothetical protein